MSTEAEGFICPYCLVGFATSSKLQDHFVEMHSGQASLDEVDYGNGEEEVCTTKASYLSLSNRERGCEGFGVV